MHETTQTLSSTGAINVAVLVYPGVELFDFAGSMEVFRHVTDAHIYTISAGVEAGQRVPTRHQGLKLKADFTLATAPQPDVLIIPGGSTDTVDDNALVLKWIVQAHQAAVRIIPVGTGSKIASHAGLVSDQMITGTAAGIDGALQAVRQLKGLEAAQVIADRIEYQSWKADSGLATSPQEAASERAVLVG